MLSLLFIVSMGACGNFGGCGACGAVSPLPGGSLPANQTVEGGGQIRVTPQGFAKLTAILPPIINNALAGGMCIPAGSQDVSIIGFSLASAQYCHQNSGGTCTNGCKVSVGLNQGGFSTQVVNNNLRVGISTNFSTSIHLVFKVLGATVDSCDLGVSSNNLNGSFDVAFGIKPANGELDVHLANINSFNLNLNFSGCGILSSFGNLIAALLDAIPNAIKGLLTPLIDPLIQSFLPNPLGIAGMMDVGQLLAGVSPGTNALMEARMVPGGYVNLGGNGMSLGLITGLNSDEDPSTRTGTRPDGIPYVSEPALCVPPLPAPDFSAPPASLPTVAGRNTFALAPANEFNGMPDPAADLAMGISETTLDLAGHHMVTSGMMCLGVGTTFIKQLNVGTIGILVPSLSELQSDKGNDPLLLVTRPQKDVDFTIGDNTDTSPALTISLNHLEVDFYAFLYERYVRAFTLDLTMNIGVNLTFQQQPGMPAEIVPMLVGISADKVQLKVLNSQFVAETPAHLEMVLPSVFDLVTPLLGNLPPIQVPSFAGFSLNNLSIQHVTTAQDDFLALYASLGGPMNRLLDNNPFATGVLRQMADGPMPPRSEGRATLRTVYTPPEAIVRGALLHQAGGTLPSITFDVDRYDSRGRELEWTWNFNGGMWHPFTSASPLVITDRAFAWQGKYTIGLRSRVKGDYRTMSDVIETPVVIDSVGPRVFTDKATWDADQLTVPVWDVVSGKAVQVAFGRAGEDKPVTAWQTGDATISRAQATEIANTGDLAVWAKDELGNQTIAIVAPFHGSAGTTGCGCQSSGRPGAGGLALLGIVAFSVLRRRRRHRTGRALKQVGLWAAMSVMTAFVPGCSCGNSEKSCETAKDCGPDFCPKGQLPFCIDNQCVCSDDIPPGRIGPYSDVAVGPGGAIWVSAYAQTYGDLVVAQATGGRIPDEAWEWVDGVPDGPVIVPGSMIRGGIADNGIDTGMYTSIAVAPDGTPMVSYFDRETASLKFAAKVNGTWQIHVVEQGTGKIDGAGGSLVGMYTSLTLRSDDGRPGIAYLAHVSDAAGERAEVRYASAQTPTPASAGDWQFWTVDTGMIPPPDPNNMDVYPLPGGLGLFIDSARDPRNQAPVVTYYDRASGDLKLSRLDPQSGQFSTPKVLDGSKTDVGWSPSVQVDAAGVAHVAYVSATADDLEYIADDGSPPELIDDGYRIVGQTVDGLPKPEFHFVGDDAGLVVPTGAGPIVVYQDATTQELLLSQRQINGMWTRSSIAGATDPWPGAYGFFASATLDATNIVMSTWVIDQPTSENWVEVFTKPTVIQ